MYLLHISPQYGELRHTSGRDRFVSLGHPCKFQRASRLDCTALQFQPRLQCIQSATGENLTEAAQIAVADRWKGYCEDLYHDEEGNDTEQEYWEKEPPPLRSEVAHAIRQTAIVAKPHVLMMSQQNGSKQEERQHWTECTEYVWRSGKPVSGQRNGRSPHSSHFPRKVIFKQCENYTEQLLWFPM